MKLKGGYDFSLSVRLSASLFLISIIRISGKFWMLFKFAMITHFIENRINAIYVSYTRTQKIICLHYGLFTAFSHYYAASKIMKFEDSFETEIT